MDQHPSARGTPLGSRADAPPPAAPAPAERSAPARDADDARSAGDANGTPYKRRIDCSPAGHDGFRSAGRHR